MLKHIFLIVAVMASLLTTSAQTTKKTATQYYNEGMALMSQSRWNDALPLFKKATELKKNYHEAFTEAGVAYVKMFNAEHAFICLREAIKIKPDYGPAYSAIGDIYKDVTKKTDSATTFYKKALDLKANTKELHYNIAWCYNERGNYETALAHLKTALEIDNEFKPAYHEIAFTYKRLNKLEDCIEQFKKNIAISKNEIALYYTGMCQLELDRKQDVLATLDTLKSINSKYVVPLQKRIDNKAAQQQQSKAPVPNQ